VQRSQCEAALPLLTNRCAALCPFAVGSLWPDGAEGMATGVGLGAARSEAGRSLAAGAGDTRSRPSIDQTTRH
jgi:hypothetical protein